MTGAIPQRLYYPIPEAAQLLGVSAEYLYDLIRAGRRANASANAISPELVVKRGNKLTIHRSYLFPNEPKNVASLAAYARLSDADKDDIAQRTVRWWMRELAAAAAIREGRAA